MHRNVRELRADLLERIGRGCHLLLYGPRGSGKSTLVADLYRRFSQAHVPCAIASSTSCLNDITCALESAYPDVSTESVFRRTARARLWRAADQHCGVLLLDHVTDVSTAMLGFLKYLRGGVVGVLFVVDIDVERERQRMRSKHLAALSVRMPPTAMSRLRMLLRSMCDQVSLDRHVETQLLRAARGRPGWIVQCAALMSEGRYWHDGQLFPTLLSGDTEFALRQGNLECIPTRSTDLRSDARASDPQRSNGESGLVSDSFP